MQAKLVGALLAPLIVSSCKSWRSPDSVDSLGTPASKGFWRQQITPIQQDLLGVSFVDRQHGLAVGDIRQMEGAILGTHDGGDHWVIIASCTELLSDVQLLDPKLAWAVGYAGRIQRTDDAGRSWKIQRYEEPNETINGVWFVDPETGWVVGASGLILHTRDGGMHWDHQMGGSSDDFWRIRMVDARRGWIVGEAGTVLHTDDGGLNWSKQTTPTHETLLGLTAIDERSALACGTRGVILKLYDASGKSSTSLDAGPVLWRSQESGSSDALNAITLLDGRIGWIAGAKGTILFTSDGGDHWRREESPAGEDLMAISAIDASRAWAVGRGGTVLRRSP